MTVPSQSSRTRRVWSLFFLFFLFVSTLGGAGTKNRNGGGLVVLGFSISSSSLPVRKVFQRCSAQHDCQTDPESLTIQDDATTATTIEWPEWTDRFLTLFQGDFDNYHQVVKDRDAGWLPREGGGHEHMHSTLLPVDPFSRLAAFYLDGIPSAIFRFRYYTISCRAADSLDLQIHFLHPNLERTLRQAPVQEWAETFRSYSQHQKPDDDADDNSPTTYVPNCDIRWTLNTTATTDDDRFHAVMLAGDNGIVIPSQMDATRLIHIRDELWLTRNQLIIHDRGRDPDTNAWIYGNQRHVPYYLDRIVDGADKNDLAWTIQGPSSPLYEQKMDRIGGPSAPPRNNKKTS